MKTRERILVTSLDLFNQCGEPNVTTIDIANEMEISPGNLYYHYRNKQDITAELFYRFEQDIVDALQAPTDPALEIIDYWMYLHIIFEKIWEYRFLYRDLANILERNNKLKKRFKRILKRKRECYQTLIHCLQQKELLNIEDAELERLITNMVITTSYWFSYQYVYESVNQMEGEEAGLAVHQILSLIAPYLTTEEQEMLQAVAETYLGSSAAMGL